MEDQGNPSNKIMASVAIAIIAILMIVLIIEGVTTQSTFDCSNITYSNTTNDTMLTASTDTIIPIGNGITSSEVKAYNNTWLDFDGVGDKVDLNYILCPKNTGFSFGVWAKGDGISAGGYVIGMGNSSLSGNFLGVLFHSTYNITMNTQNAIGSGDWIHSDILWNDTNWHNYIITYGSSDLKFYVDKNYIGTYNNDMEIEYSCFDKLSIGNLIRNTEGLWFGGDSDEYFLVNHTLNQNQINEIYNRSIHGQNLGEGVPILYYHNINMSYVSITKTNFDRQMSLLYENGYETITTRQLLDWMDGIGTLPEKPVIIQFDDGYTSSITNSSIMEDYGYVGVIAVISELVGTSDNYANWTLLQSVIDKGWEVQAHSLIHTNLSDENSTERHRIFNKTRWDIYDNLGFFPHYFTYPYNGHNDTIDAECEQYYEMCSGYQEGASYIYRGSSKTRNGILRQGMGDGVSNESLLNLLNIYRDKIISLNLNENNGTTAHDLSGNSNDGTITGATWNNDGILNTLTVVTDYTISQTTGLFTLVNSDYSWAGLIVDYTYSTIVGETCNSFGTTTMTDMRATINTAILAVVGLLSLIFTLAAIVWLFRDLKIIFSKDKGIGNMTA